MKNIKKILLSISLIIFIHFKLIGQVPDNNYGLSLLPITIKNVGEVNISTPNEYGSSYLYLIKDNKTLRRAKLHRTTTNISQQQIEDNMEKILKDGYFYTWVNVAIEEFTETFKALHYVNPREGDKGYNGWQTCYNFRFLNDGELGGSLFEDRGVRYSTNCNPQSRIVSESKSSTFIYTILHVKVICSDFPLDYSNYRRGITKMTVVDNNMPEMEIVKMSSDYLEIRVPNENPGINEYGHKRNEQYSWEEGQITPPKKDWHGVLNFVNIYKTGGQIDIKLTDSPRRYMSMEYNSKAFDLKYDIIAKPNEILVSEEEDCEKLVLEFINQGDITKYSEKGLLEKMSWREENLQKYRFVLFHNGNTYTSLEGEMSCNKLENLSQIIFDKENLTSTINMKITLEGKKSDDNWEPVSVLTTRNGYDRFDLKYALAPKNVIIENKQDYKFCSIRDGAVKLTSKADRVNNNTQYFWYKDGVKLIDGINGVKLTNLGREIEIVKSINTSDAGYYYFTASNDLCISTSDSVKVDVTPTPTSINSIELSYLDGLGGETAVSGKLELFKLVRMSFPFVGGKYYSLINPNKKEVFYGENPYFLKVFTFEDLGEWKVVSYSSDRNGANSCISDTLRTNIELKACEGANLTTNIPAVDISGNKAILLENSKVIFNFDDNYCPYCIMQVDIYPLGKGTNDKAILTSGQYVYEYKTKGVYTPVALLSINGEVLQEIALNYSILVEELNIGDLNMWRGDVISGNKLNPITNGDLVKINSLVLFELSKAWNDTDWEKIIYPFGMSNINVNIRIDENNMDVNTKLKANYSYSQNGKYKPIIAIKNKHTGNEYEKEGVEFEVSPNGTKRTYSSSIEEQRFEFDRFLTRNNQVMKAKIKSHINDEILISILDAKGRLVHSSSNLASEDSEREIHIDLSSLTNGTYFVMYRFLSTGLADNNYIEIVNL